MYLISAYFDKKTEHRIQSYINGVEMSCGNTIMTDNSVPPHMTMMALETLDEKIVLNEYLHNLSSVIYESIVNLPDTKISKYYKPFSWLPHATIAKQLSEDEMRKAFEVLQKSFGVFEGEVVRIELAKKSPYRVIASWELSNRN